MKVVNKNSLHDKISQVSHCCHLHEHKNGKQQTGQIYILCLQPVVELKMIQSLRKIYFLKKAHQMKKMNE